MKTKLINLFAITALIVTAVSCKGEKKNETKATEAEKEIKAPATAVTYNIDPSSSLINWVGKKPTGQHIGTLNITSGSLKTLEGTIQSGTFTIDMKTIAVTDLEGDDKASLEGHLKGLGEGEGADHFFNVTKFPTASFDLTGISEENGKTIIQGNLTIKGIKKNISFPATTSVEADAVRISSDIFTINRTDWGVNYGSKSIFDNLGDKFINDDIELRVSLLAKKA